MARPDQGPQARALAEVAGALASAGQHRRAEATTVNALLTSISARISVSGVRSSCEALATNRRWLARCA